MNNILDHFYCILILVKIQSQWELDLPSQAYKVALN